MCCTAGLKIHQHWWPWGIKMLNKWPWWRSRKGEWNITEIIMEGTEEKEGSVTRQHTNKWWQQLVTLHFALTVPYCHKLPWIVINDYHCFPCLHPQNLSCPACDAHSVDQSPLNWGTHPAEPSLSTQGQLKTVQLWKKCPCGFKKVPLLARSITINFHES